jgi:hypothetical protein
MNRTLMAAALAAALIPAAGGTASAAPYDTFSRTYTLGCAVDQFDGVSLKAGKIILRNTTPHLLRQGATIQLSVARQINGRRQELRLTETLYRDVPAGHTIALDQPPRALRCVAQVTLQPNARIKLDRIIRR